MYEKLVNYAAKQLELDPAEITPDATFESLGIDSLDIVEMIMDLESELGVELDMIELAQPVLIHAKLGAYNARHKYGVDDEEILKGILYHTTGAADMTELAKVVYLADMLEPARDFPGIEELRKQAFKDLDKAMLIAYDSTMRYLLDSRLLLHPRCIEGYNQLRMQAKKE